MIAIYARQSVDKKDSISIESQIDMCKRECSELEHFTVYSDKGYSGKNTNRPELAKLLKDVEEGKIKKIIVYRLDRLSRSIVDFGQMWKKLDENNVEFVSINENFDTSTPMGRAMIYIIMVFAQLERETIGERIKDNYYSRIKRGNWPGGPAPFGFENSKKHDIDGRQVPTLSQTKDIEVVKRIFCEYAKEGVSLGQIAKELTKEGVQCMKRKAWDNVALSRIIHSPVYVNADIEVYLYYKKKGIQQFSNDIDEFSGEYSAHIIGKRNSSTRKYTSLEGHVLSLTNFQGVIPSDIWLKCQHKLDQNKQVGNSGKGKNSWLSGLIKCGNCGYSISIRKWKDKQYLNCSGRSNLHLCDVKSFSTDILELEKAVENELVIVIENCSQEPVESQELLGDNNVKIELTKIEEKIERLINGLAESSDIAMSYINKEIEKLDNQKKDLLAQLSNTVSNIKEQYKDIVFGELDFEDKKLVVRSYIDKVVVYPEEIEIVWKV